MSLGILRGDAARIVLLGSLVLGLAGCQMHRPAASGSNFETIAWQDVGSTAMKGVQSSSDHAQYLTVPDRYRPPADFLDVVFGKTTLAAFRDRHPNIDRKGGMDRVRSPGKVTHASAECTHVQMIDLGGRGLAQGPAMAGKTEVCTAMRAENTIEGAGDFLYVEVYEPDWYLLFNGGVAAIAYGFCGPAPASKKIPAQITENSLTACAIDVVFPEVAERIVNGETTPHPNYRLIVEGLLEMWGLPDDYSNNGIVVVETLDGEVVKTPHANKPRHWVWGAVAEEQIEAAYPTSVALYFDPEAKDLPEAVRKRFASLGGLGRIHITTKAANIHAYGKHVTTDPDNLYYRIMRSGGMQRHYRKSNVLHAFKRPFDQDDPLREVGRAQQTASLGVPLPPGKSREGETCCDVQIPLAKTSGDLPIIGKVKAVRAGGADTAGLQQTDRVSSEQSGADLPSVTVRGHRIRKTKRPALIQFFPNGDLICVQPKECASVFGTPRGDCRSITSDEQFKRCLAQMNGDRDITPEESDSPP